ANSLTANSPNAAPRRRRELAGKAEKTATGEEPCDCIAGITCAVRLCGEKTRAPWYGRGHEISPYDGARVELGGVAPLLLAEARFEGAASTRRAAGTLHAGLPRNRRESRRPGGADLQLGPGGLHRRAQFRPPGLWGG